MKSVKVEYIESGTFCGGEEDCFDAEIETGESCVVLKRIDYESLIEENKRLVKNIKELKAIFPKILEALGNGSWCCDDCSIEFLKEIPREVQLVIREKSGQILLFESVKSLCEELGKEESENLNYFIRKIANGNWKYEQLSK